MAPLADALAPLLDSIAADPEADAGVRVDPARGFVDPAEVLALSLGLGGALELDGLLTDGAASPPAPAAPVLAADPDAAVSREALRAETRKRFATLETAVRRRLRAAARGRSRVRDPEAFHAALRERRGFGRRGARAAASVAGEQCEALLVVVTNLIDRVRGEARGLRLEVGPAIAALGPGAASLERLDATLARASARITAQWFARIPHALGLEFVKQTRAAARSLPEDAALCEVEAWYAAGGFVAALSVQIEQALDAVIDHERQALFGLLDAALRIDVDATPAAHAADRDDLAGGGSTEAPPRDEAQDGNRNTAQAPDPSGGGKR